MHYHSKGSLIAALSATKGTWGKLIMLSRGIVTSVSVTLLMSLADPCQAADFSKPGEERFKLSAGVFLQNFDTTVRVKGDGGSGEYLALEDDLGYDDNDRAAWLGGYWRFASRHRIAVSYFESSRDVEGVAQTDIDIGDGETLPAGAGFTSEFKIKVLPVQYLYSFMKRDKFELAGTVGLHWYSVDYDIAGAAGIGSIDVSDSVSVDADAPMPLIGLSFDYYISNRWHVNLLGEAFALEIDAGDLNFQGSIFNTRLGTEYWIWKNVGVGAAINWFAMNVDVDDSSWNGNLEYDYWGPQAYLTARF